MWLWADQPLLKTIWKTKGCQFPWWKHLKDNLGCAVQKILGYIIPYRAQHKYESGCFAGMTQGQSLVQFISQEQAGMWDIWALLRGSFQG